MLVGRSLLVPAHNHKVSFVGAARDSRKNLQSLPSCCRAFLSCRYISILIDNLYFFFWRTMYFYKFPGSLIGDFSVRSFFNFYTMLWCRFIPLFWRNKYVMIFSPGLKELGAVWCYSNQCGDMVQLFMWFAKNMASQNHWNGIWDRVLSG